MGAPFRVAVSYSVQHQKQFTVGAFVIDSGVLRPKHFDERQCAVLELVPLKHLSMLSPMGGPQAYVGHLTSITFPTLWNLTKNLGPTVGMFALFAQRNGTKSHRPMCLSVCWPILGIVVAKTAVFNRSKQQVIQKLCFSLFQGGYI